MAVIVVRRKEPTGTECDRMRAYRIEVDGSDSGRLRRGEELRLEVPPGEHRVRALIDWQGSEPITVNVPEQGEVLVSVKTQAHMGNAWRMVFARSGWLSLEATQYPS